MEGFGMAKVMKFADKVKKVKRHDAVNFVTDDGDVIEFKVESRSSDVMEALSQKYDALKPTAPTKKLPTNKGGVRIVSNEEDPTYKRELAKISKMHFAHMALIFLAEGERPEGSEEEQIKEIQEVELAGFVGKIVSKGLEISGLTNNDADEEVDEAKND
jgi:hypothetical protein